MTTPSRSAVLVAVGGMALTAGSVALPWITVGLAGDATTYAGLRILPATVPVLLAALATTALALASLHRPRLVRPAAAAGLVAVLLEACVIGLVELIGLALPTSFLPATIRRGTAVLGAEYGAWLALVGSAIATIALLGGGSLWHSRYARRLRGERLRGAGVVGILVLVIVAGWLRYQPWVAGVTLNQQLRLPEWAAPWLGPLSLFALWMLIGAAVLLAFAGIRVAGLVTATAGWLISFLAAVTVVAADAVGEFGLDSAFPAATNSQIVEFAITPFVWITYCLGLTVAVLGAWLVYCSDRSGN